MMQEQEQQQTKRDRLIGTFCAQQSAEAQLSSALSVTPSADESHTSHLATSHQLHAEDEGTDEEREAPVTIPSTTTAQYSTATTATTHKEADRDSSCSTVVTLDLATTHVGDAGVAFISTYLLRQSQQTNKTATTTAGTKRVKLDVSGNEATTLTPLCELLTSTVQQNEAKEEDGCFQITSLDISRNRLSHQATAELVESLLELGPRASSLTELDISHSNAISDTISWQQLFDETQRIDTKSTRTSKLSTFPLRLQKFHCSDEPLIHVPTVGPLLSSICRSVFLTHLSLNNCMLENEAIVMLAEGLCPPPQSPPPSTTTTTSSEAAATAHQPVRYCSNLKVLSLRKNRIGCTGLAALSFALAGMQGPPETLVSKTRADQPRPRPVAPKHVTRALTQTKGHVPPLTSLETLDLSGNSMLAWIKEAEMPQRQRKYKPALGDVVAAPTAAATTTATTRGGVTQQKPSSSSHLPDVTPSRSRGRCDPTGLIQLGYALMFLRGLKELHLDSCDLGDGANDSPFFGCERGGVSELCDGARNTAAIGGGRLKVLSLVGNGFDAKTQQRLARISGFRAVF